MTADLTAAAAELPKPLQTMSLDGQVIAFTPGQSVLQLASQQQVEIPYYCWHPRLSVAANCRMCLVEVEKSPKLVPSCQTLCQQGMIVHTQTPRVKAAQKAVHEFLLINHPIDCPICDQAGECKLQDYYMKYQLAPSRMRDKKVAKNKLIPLGPHVMLNAERCIVCTRCVRFMEEIAKDRQLGVMHRGDHAMIGTVDGQPLDNPYALNTVDVCPVGALTSTVFRFKQRVWNLSRGKSLCPGCARGCNVHVDHRAGQVYRLLPRENEHVNQSWLCDEGRLCYQRANTQPLTSAWVKNKTMLVPTLPTTAQAAAVTVLQAAAVANKPLLVILSFDATVEDAYLLAQLGRAQGDLQVLCLGYADGEADTWLRVADKNPNRLGVQAVLTALNIAQITVATLQPALFGAVLWLGVAMEQQDQEALVACLQGLPTVVLAAQEAPALQAAQVVLPLCSWVEQAGTWINSTGRAQALTAALTPVPPRQPAHNWLQAIFLALGHPLPPPLSAQWDWWPTTALPESGLAIAELMP